MNTRCGIAAVVVSILSIGILASTASADCFNTNGTSAGWVLLWSRTGSHSSFPNDCRIDPGVDTVVVRISAIPFQRAQLTVADPPFGTVVGEHWYFPSTGNRQSGVELDMGGCTTAGVVQLGEIYISVDYNVVSPSALAQWATGTAQIQNCTGRWLPAGHIGIFMSGFLNFNGPYLQCWQCAYTTQPYDLFPPDGATNVPLDAKLSWKGTQGTQCRVYISRDPTCTTFQDLTPYPLTSSAFDPGPLSPSTTYYWRPHWDYNDGWGSYAWAPIHSFKTVGPVATTPATWGRVKSMYRE